MKRSYDSTGINMGGDYPTAPEGVYTLIIKSVRDTKEDKETGEIRPWKTKNGDDYAQATCEVIDEEYKGIKVWYGITLMDDKKRKGAGMALQFLKSIGEPYKGKFDIDTDNWIGHTFKAKLIVGKDLQGKAKNEIAYIVTEEMEAMSDEVPF